jgi:hypothetical protein
MTTDFAPPYPRPAPRQFELVAALYREAFERYGASVPWSSRPVPDPSPEDTLVMTLGLAFLQVDSSATPCTA